MKSSFFWSVSLFLTFSASQLAMASGAGSDQSETVRYSPADRSSRVISTSSYVSPSAAISELVFLAETICAKAGGEKVEFVEKFTADRLALYSRGQSLTAEGWWGALVARMTNMTNEPTAIGPFVVYKKTTRPHPRILQPDAAYVEAHYPTIEVNGERRLVRHTAYGLMTCKSSHNDLVNIRSIF
jgi:hypothetical protein